MQEEDGRWWWRSRGKYRSDSDPKESGEAVDGGPAMRGCEELRARRLSWEEVEVARGIG